MTLDEGIASAMQRLDIVLADHEIGIQGDALAALPAHHDADDVDALADDLACYHTAMRLWRSRIETELRSELTRWLAGGDRA